MARDDRRRRSFFPSVDSRFMGALEPSPRMGSYYNPSRYANQGFSAPELARIQRNLGNVYQQDVEYNRVANPRYQTTQDTGYSSTAQFGSGRASPATVQQYALKFGTPTGNGLSTFTTPSGGSITYKPSGRILPGGVAPTVSPGSQNLSEPLAAANFDYAGNWQKGFGTGATPYPQQPQPGLGYAANLAYNKLSQAANTAFTLPAVAYNAFFGKSSATAGAGAGGVTPQQPTYAAQPPGPRRYFDY